MHTSFRLKKNNFDLLRLVFATIVLLVHSYDLSGFEQLRIITSFLSSGLAVKAFFVVSGFLIVMSFERSTDVMSYAKNRFLRIFPAYFSVVIICAVFLFAVSSKSLGEYFSIGWVKYLIANLSFLNFLQPTLPGVFETNKMPVVNGALWTLKLEVMFYVAVPLFVVLFRKFRHVTAIALIYLLSVAYSEFFSMMAIRTGSEFYAELGRQLPGKLSYFISGTFLYYYLPLFERRVGYFLIAALAIMAFNAFYPVPFLEPFAVATVVIFLGLFLYVGNFGKYGDFSYGVYILHFPIIQVLLFSGWLRESPWYFLIAAMLITAIGAVAMWHLVEKRFLNRKKHNPIAVPACGSSPLVSIETESVQ